MSAVAATADYMGYLHDIFISYRRNKLTHAWIVDHFVPLLAARVEFELERSPQIYVDDQLESGTSWPAALGVALGSSRILIPLWSKNYLSSKWCVQELSLMLSRETAEGRRTPERPRGLIVPVFIHDGERFPKALRDIQHFEIQKLFNLRMGHNTLRAEELDVAIAGHAAAIAACIQNAPVWREQWPNEAAAQFFKQFHQEEEDIQTIVPGFTTL